MAYEHGITVQEAATTVSPPVLTSAGVQVVIGTAPVHLADDLSSVVNKPLLANTLAEAKSKLGYSKSFDKYTLCEAMYASFELFQIGPIVFINVLDPAVHKTDVTDGAVTIKNKAALVDVEGVLLNTVIVKSSDGTTTYNKNVDYTIAFNTDGKPVISILSSGAIPTGATSLKLSYSNIDPSKVTIEDIIGGYDSVTGKSTGIELIQQVYPATGLIPGLILAPGWSHNPEVAAIIDAKSRKINGSFNAENILDVDSSTVKKYEDVPEWKSTNGYTSEKSIVLWPKVKIGDTILWYSSLYAALAAYTDSVGEDVPYQSPSNKTIPISATVLADGSEVYLDLPQANYLNGQGIVTAINLNAWKAWGNNTGAYPNTTDPKDRFIPVRRVMDWWGNTFIQSYFAKVDDPLNYRLIESLVDSENLRANGYQAKGQIAGASIEFREDMNPETDLLNGKITFVQKIAAFTPAENIVNILEFDPTILTGAIFGGE